MRVADRVWERLSEEVDTVFYLPGGGSSHLVDALGSSGLKAICCSHEQGAGYAAVGYAQIHGFGVCLTTSGPGATNALTPCLAAWTDSVPVLFISGQVMLNQIVKPGLRTRLRSLGTQEAPTIKMAEPITKYAELVRGVKSAEQRLNEVIRLIKLGRFGPAWLDYPQDIQALEIE